MIRRLIGYVDNDFARSKVWSAWKIAHAKSLRRSFRDGCPGAGTAYAGLIAKGDSEGGNGLILPQIRVLPEKCPLCYRAIAS